MNLTNQKFLTIAIIVALAIGFAGGFWYQQHPFAAIGKDIVNRDGGQSAGVDFGLFWQVYDALRAKYVDPSKIDSQKVLYGAISGMVSSLGDPYTVFFEPVTSQKFQEEISGAFGGIGTEIGKRNDILTIIAPIKDSPADKAGIKTGDRILKINDKDTSAMSVEEAVNIIRGPKGSKVTLTISPENSTTTRVVELVRDTIKIPAVTWKMVNGHIAYMQIYAFNQNVDSEFKKASQELLKAGADRLIVDLRNNPGGLLDSAVDLSGWFLDKNSLVTTEDFGNGSKNEYRTSGDAQLKNLPTVFLINGGSASASEILAGAVHDNRHIQLVGDKSFGKGSVQELQNFSDGSSLKVTIAKWLTPNGISISAKGIEPDVSVKIDDKDVASGKVEAGTPGKDPQLDKAIEIIK